MPKKMTVIENFEQTEKAHRPMGYVYFIQGDNGPIKIGFSTGIPEKGRLKSLQIGSPVKLGVVAKIQTQQEIEQILHSCFAESRLHGEWFEPTAALLDLMKRVKENSFNAEEFRLSWRKNNA